MNNLMIFTISFAVTLRMALDGSVHPTLRMTSAMTACLSGLCAAAEIQRLLSM